MRWLTCAVILSLFSALLAPAAYGQSNAPAISFEVDAPRFPSPLQTSAIGLTLTAVAVIGARVSHRTSDTMMYMVLASLAVTAVMVAYADRLHSEFVRAGFQKLTQLEQQAAAVQKS